MTAGAEADFAVTNLNSAATKLDSDSGGQPPPDARYCASTTRYQYMLYKGAISRAACVACGGYAQA